MTYQIYRIILSRLDRTPLPFLIHIWNVENIIVIFRYTITINVRDIIFFTFIIIIYYNWSNIIFSS